MESKNLYYGCHLSNGLSCEIDIVGKIRNKFPKLYVTKIFNDGLKFGPENDNGYIEYKRTLVDCTTNRKQQQYATQMRWRITNNIKNQYAIYYIGVDDDGTIVGLVDREIIQCINLFVLIAASINASISRIEIIYINNQCVVKICVKNKKIRTNYLVEFDDD